MAITKEDVLEFISNLSVLELSELVKEFEEKFGVSAAPVMVAGAAGGAAGVGIIAFLLALLKKKREEEEEKNNA